MKSLGKGCHWRELTCNACGKKFMNHSKPAKNYYCSKECYFKKLKGEDNPNWKGGGTERICKICEKKFVIGKAQLNYKGYGTVCSIKCRNELFRIRGKVSKEQKSVDRQIKSLLGRAIRGNNYYKKCKDILGYTGIEFKEHMESLFKEGMSWSNYGRWHLDHIIPKRSFVYESINDKQVKECWALDNLQPLWAEENLKKGAFLLT